MNITHIALWTKDLEKSKDFYSKYFLMQHSEKYYNPTKEFESYFMCFQETDKVTIELMQMPNIAANEQLRGKVLGYAHMAISVGGKLMVDQLTEQLRKDGYSIVGEPRTTGDGFYESIVEDPEGNWVEITE